MGQFISCCLHPSPSHCCQQFWFVVSSHPIESAIWREEDFGNMPKNHSNFDTSSLIPKWIPGRCLIPARLFKLLIILAQASFALALNRLFCMRKHAHKSDIRMYECANNLQGILAYNLLQFRHDFWIKNTRWNEHQTVDCAYGHHDAALFKKKKGNYWSHLLNFCILFSICF